MRRLIVPPLPAASRPSTKMTNFCPFFCAQIRTFRSVAFSVS